MVASRLVVTMVPLLADVDRGRVVRRDVDGSGGEPSSGITMIDVTAAWCVDGPSRVWRKRAQQKGSSRHDQHRCTNQLTAWHRHYSHTVHFLPLFMCLSTLCLMVMAHRSGVVVRAAASRVAADSSWPDDIAGEPQRDGNNDSTDDERFLLVRMAITADEWWIDDFHEEEEAPTRSLARSL